MAIKQYVSLNEPLCGIGTYKDTLNLDTGATVRWIKKLVLDGTEDWQNYGQVPNTYRLSISNAQSIGNPAICSHFVNSPISEIISGKFTVGSTWIYIRYTDVTDITDFKAYLAQQYANGTPVTVWYVLATPTTSTTALPRGLSGIVEGSLTQSGTPTPTNSIYPTANSINSFLDKKYLKYGTETDTITTLPKTIIGDGQSASAVIKGNMAQNGTPTPSNPIMPQGTGDKTANWFDIGSVTHQTLSPDGTISYESTMDLSGFIKVNGDFTVSWTAVRAGAYMRVSIYDDNKTFIERVTATNTYNNTQYSYSHSGYIRINYENSYGLTNIMLNSGLTALPFEPFGYKIPISSGGTTTPVYLGEVETTRSIIKRTFTGSEIWYYGDGIFTWLTTGVVPGAGLCSHFSYGSSSTDENFNIILNAQQYIAFQFRYNSITSLSDFKQWLSDQYTAGTPVTIWYRRSTPKTTTLNEPLMKISDYADSISGISIPTIAGANTLDVLTTVQPSEVTASFNGWHPVTAAHERSGGAWS